MMEVGKWDRAWHRRRSRKGIWIAAEKPHGWRSNHYCHAAQFNCKDCSSLEMNFVVAVQVGIFALDLFLTDITKAENMLVLTFLLYYMEQNNG